MAGMSQGNSYPEYGSTNSRSLTSGVSHSNATVRHSRATDSTDINGWQDAVNAAIARVASINATTHELNKTSEQRGHSWSLPVEPERQARIPVWTSRREWLRQFRHHISSPAGKALCARRLIKPDKAYAVAEAHAHFADANTGRGVTAARSTIAARAKVSESAVNRARRVLVDLQMGVEHVRGRRLRTIEFLAAEAHHGGRQSRAASTWALSSPRSVVESTPPIGIPKRGDSHATERAARSRLHTSRHSTVGRELRHPPAATATDTLSSVGYLSCEVLPLGRTHQRAGARIQSPNKTTQCAVETPRPLQLQRAAAELLTHAPALSPPGHIGAVCDLLIRAGIDHTRWSGRDIAHALSADTKERGWIWPTASSLTSPLAYLQHRIRGIDWSRRSPRELREAADLARRQEQKQRESTRQQRDQNAASSEHRAQVLANIRAHLHEPSRQH